MKERIIKYLSCPYCPGENDLNLEVSEIDKTTNHIMTGTLSCSKCNTIYPIKNGVPFFCTHPDNHKVNQNKINFANEWNYFTNYIDQKLAKDELDSYFHTFVTYKDLDDKIILDAGCGGGRFSYIFANESKAKEIFAVDFSDATSSAFKNTKHLDSINIIQADITNLPFKNKKIFDFIYTVGVLHHLPNPQEGFSSLSKHLKQEGKILAWVYGKEGNELYIYFADPIRKLITSKLPFKINLALSFIISTVLWAIIWLIYFPLNKTLSHKAMNKFLPFNEYFEFFRKRGLKDFWRTILDKMIPTISNHISKEEFTSWFKKNDLNYKLYFRNMHSWLGIGEYSQEKNYQNAKSTEALVSS